MNPTASLGTLREQIERRGYAALPALYDADELARMRALIDHDHALHGSPDLAGWGHPIHPLLTRIPDFAPYYRHPALVAALEDVLGGPVRLAHSGARLSSDRSAASIGWHHHYFWPIEEVPARARCARILVNVYVDGTDDLAGPLQVLPRRLTDGCAAAAPADQGDWPGQELVRVAPGSAVIFDTALWHSARRGARAGHRRLWGGHFQLLSDRRAHGEDNGDPGVQCRRLTAGAGVTA